VGGTFTRAIYRLDGFMSLDAGYDGGQFVTPPLVYTGDHLELNFDGSAGGWAKVELQHADGNPLAGFSEKDSGKVVGNSVAKTVAWGGKSDLSWLRGKPVKLRVVMRDAKLYAFQFAKGKGK
jgi:hypothetical protein